MLSHKFLFILLFADNSTLIEIVKFVVFMGGAVIWGSGGAWRASAADSTPIPFTSRCCAGFLGLSKLWC